MKKIVPGFGLTLGITTTMLGLLVLLPLAGLAVALAGVGPAEFMRVLTEKQVVAAGWVSLSGALLAAALNLLFGVLLAWVLTRYEFPGKRLLDSLLELPFALPTAVAGITLTALYSDQGLVGAGLARLGIRVAYTRSGIVLAMIFTGIPFVVRNVQPVLEKLDKSGEEAAAMLGAQGPQVFWTAVFPRLLPAALSGFGLAFARGLGEYGSVVFIAGNIPYRTQFVPLLIMTKLEQYQYDEAAVIALTLLGLSLLILFLTNLIQSRLSRRLHI